MRSACLFAALLLAAPAPARVWRSSFESLEPFRKFYAVPSPHQGTAWHAPSTDKAHSGEFSHKAWLDGANARKLGYDADHRAYLTVQLNKTKGGGYHTPCLVEWWVWTDLSLEKGACDWLGLAAFTPEKGGEWRRQVELREDAEGKLGLASGSRKKPWAPSFQNASAGLPRYRWVKLSVYLDMRPGKSQAWLWMDGRRMSGGRLPALQGRLEQLHLALKAERRCRKGAVYEDDLAIYEAGSFDLAAFKLEGSARLP